MSSYNRVIMIGNLTRDPDFKQLASGQSVCRLGLASNRQFKNRQSGQMVQEVCFIDIDVWGPQADSCYKFLQKGRSVLIEGRIKFDTWEDQDGRKQSKHSVVADRVTFLSNAQNEANIEEDGISMTPVNDSPVQKTILKARKAVARAENNSTGGEIDFKNEEAFEDELPF